MATATQILDRASAITGLRATSTERTLAMQALQNAYYRTLMESECYVTSASSTLTGGQMEYEVSACLGTATATATAVAVDPYILKIREAIVQKAAGLTLYKLKGVSEGQMLEMDRGTMTTGGIPRYFAVIGNRTLKMWPAPATNDILRLYYVPMPKNLVESTATPSSSEEITPTMVPTQFHWDCLLAGTIVEMLDKDQRSRDVQFWEQRYMDGIARIKQWSASFMGDANPMWVEDTAFPFKWNDQRSRR